MRITPQIIFYDFSLATEDTSAAMTDMFSTLYDNLDVFLRGGSLQVKHRDDILRRDATLLFQQFDNPVNKHSALFMSFWSWYR